MLARLAIGGVIAAGALSASADTLSSSLVERFMAREDTPLRSYRAFRTLRAENARFSKRARLEAWTSLTPEEGFTFEIVAEEGSGTVRKKVLRAALEAEARAFATGESTSAAPHPRNYEFGPPELLQDGHSRVPITARRKEPLLINGGIVLTADADLVRIEGQLVKKPSFWVNRAEVVREYARIGGVRVPVRVASTAWLKMAGRSTFEMTYAYQAINGSPVASAGR
ncbi:MAG: hypothetical protein ACRD1S_10170 [Vicinamibacterales bacterium]